MNIVVVVVVLVLNSHFMPRPSRFDSASFVAPSPSSTLSSSSSLSISLLHIHILGQFCPRSTYILSIIFVFLFSFNLCLLAVCCICLGHGRRGLVVHPLPFCNKELRLHILSTQPRTFLPHSPPPPKTLSTNAALIVV